MASPFPRVLLQEQSVYKLRPWSCQVFIYFYGIVQRPDPEAYEAAPPPAANLYFCVMGGRGQGQPPARDFQDIELLRCHECHECSVTKRNISLTSNVTLEDLEALASQSLTNKKLVILRINSARRFNRTSVNTFISLRHIVDSYLVLPCPDVGLKISFKF